MRSALTLLMLVNLCVQQFVCCAESCGTCGEPAEPQHVASCEHDAHEHDHHPQLPAGDDSSHHLCVATHLFYLRAAIVDLDAAHAIVSHLDIALPQMSDSFNTIDVVSCSVPPPAALRTRAVLGVWTI